MDEYLLEEVEPSVFIISGDYLRNAANFEAPLENDGHRESDHRQSLHDVGQNSRLQATLKK